MKNSSAIKFIYLSLLIINQLIYLVIADNCYAPNGMAKRCSPDFINAAYNRTATATNTCGGNTRKKYCVQTHFQYEYGESRFEKCDVCDINIFEKSHPPEYLTDYHNQNKPSWWQSDSMEYDIQHPKSINITLHLGKSFDINYVQIKFHSSRPDSFVIYKRTNETSDWVPYQYYSSNCEEIYNVSRNQLVTRENQLVALCTDEFSDIAPLSGGSVVFGPLVDRPNAFNFENDEQLQEWVTATEIRISLNRLNTFGDEVFGDPRVLQSYYYAISDISVGGRCKCNGHAERCLSVQHQDLEDKYKCECQHNTDGSDCEKCAPFFNDRPWAPATFSDANECLPCNCNGRSRKCVFNQTLYETTLHGGYCIDCERNTEGPHCEDCIHGYFRNEYDNECTACECNKEGSVSMQCDPNGQCKCKPGVTGDKCDRCVAFHYDFAADGCKKCSCSEIGSLDAPPYCEPKEGKCRCKPNVEGKNCDKCKPGFFNLDPTLTKGCLSCFCYGHSSDCTSSKNYLSYSIESNNELRNLEEWKAVDSLGQRMFVNVDNATGVSLLGTEKDGWFVAPNTYIGNQLGSYNQELSFKLKFRYQPSYNKKDIIIENGYKRFSVYQSFWDILEQDPINQESQTKEFKFKLLETSGWLPRLSSKDFQTLISNITSIKIRATYTFLHKFKLNSAQHKKVSTKSSSNRNELTLRAPWVEDCKCPISHTGQFCEKCQVGYKRQRQFGDLFTKCVPCACNNHSSSCDPDTGKCNCVHQTTGDSCERCEVGYYGDATGGTSNDCKKCMCPNDGPCAEIFNFQSNLPEVVCLNCPEGTTGNLCELCDDGYFKVEDQTSTNTVCKKCQCNSNIDTNAVGNCNTNTGQCLRCIYNTTGDSCEKCLNSYWGNALSSLKCHACECYSLGSVGNECDLNKGQCTCKNNVIGRRCDECKNTYWNIKSGEGCIDCKCNPLGSVSLSCDQNNGVCSCRPGVTGSKCDQCLPNHYGFSAEGCKPCDCDPFGSLSQQCDLFGKCKCRENVGGYKCDKCVENYQNFTVGCVKCPDCYNLVDKSVQDLRKNISMIEESLKNSVSDDDSSENKEKNKQLELQLNQLKLEIQNVYTQIFSKETYDLFASSYNETIQKLNNTLESINIEFKKLQKPLDTFKDRLKMVEFLHEKLNKTLIELETVPDKLKRLETDLDHSKNFSEWIKEQHEDEHDSNKTAIQLKLTADAASVRRISNEQLRTASFFANKVEEVIEGSKVSLDELNRLEITTKNMKQIKFDINHDELSKTGKELLEEADSTKDEVEETYKNIENSIKKLTDIKFDETDYETKDLKSNFDLWKEFDLSLKSTTNDVDILNKRLETSLIEYEKSIKEAKKSLKTVEAKDKDMTLLLERSNNSKTRIQQASSEMINAFENATFIRDTLKNFDELVQDGRHNITKAEPLKPQIKTNLEKSQELFTKVNSGMKNAKQNIVKATNDIKLANASISKENKNFEEKFKIADGLKNKSSILKEEVSQLQTKHSNGKKNKEKSIEIYKSLPETLENLNKNAASINLNAKTLLNKVKTADDDLLDLSFAQLTFEGVSSDQVQQLTKKFNETLAEFNKYELEKLDEELAFLLFQQELSQKLVKAYEREIPELKRSLDDLTHIRDAIYSVAGCKTVIPLPPAI